ncbi:MAG TPA: ABC transporter permease [Vicinamibacterales bacterium]|nr:ABC transporter permease [Vicinamibacterales bacterium]
MPPIESYKQDLRYAFRVFRREPGVSLIAIVILALGIGANTAVFSIVNPLLLRQLPFPNAERLVWIANTGTSGGLSGATFRVDWYEEFLRNNRSFESLAAYFAFFGYGSYTLTGRGEAERLVGVDVGPQFFETLGVTPALGRLFGPGEHHHSGASGGGTSSGPHAAILAHGLWLRRFGADPAIVGSVLTINNRAVTVVGVLPATFDFSSVFTPGTRVDLFVPADLDQMRPWGNTLAIVGRLRPGVDLLQARGEFATLLPQLMAAHKDWGRVGARLLGLKDQVSGRMRPSLILLWSAVGTVLLIVCANLANLLLARASSRSREFAVRMALGAGRARLIRQLLIEGVLLAIVGAAIGVPLAYGLTVWLVANDSMSLPLLHFVRIDTTALLVTAAIACLTGVVFAAVPALRVSGVSPQSALQEHGRGMVDSVRQAWIRRGLVVAEIALAGVLLVGAGLLARSFLELLDVELGFEPSRAVAARVDVPSESSLEQRTTIGHEIIRRVSALPGVEAAGLTDALPLERNRTWGLRVPGKIYGPGETPIVFVYVVSPGYFSAMGIRITAGRDFVEHDPMKDRAPVIVNATLARTLYPGVDPIGRPAVTGNQPLTIVGVVADVRQSGLDEAPVNQMYLDLSRGSGVGSDLIVRTTLPPASMATALRGTLAEVDARLVASDVRVLDSLVDRSLSPRRFLVSLLSGFSLLALLLASLGIYGVVSYGVSQRTAEIGVRMALGATGRDVRRQVIGDTMRLTAAGVAIGTIASLALARLIASLLYATSPFDAMTFVMAVVVLTAVALLAGYLPALRASRIEPMRALRD